jgi:hypothetical protein
MRAIQVIAYLFLAVSYFFQYAIVLSNYKVKNERLL